MFNKIIAGLLSLLFWLFPFLQPKPQNLNPETVAANLMRAVETRAVDLFTDQLCLNIKQNANELPEKITELFDTIEGDFIDYTWQTRGGYWESQRNGKALSQVYLDIELTTTEKTYLIISALEFHNTFQPAERGIRAFWLHDGPDSPTILFRMEATDGIMAWHE